MTRSWNFSLLQPQKWYNLWYDLIVKDPSFLDSTFSNSEFVASQVAELEIQNQTPGSTVTRGDGKKENGFALTGGSWDVNRNERNVIDLKNVNLQTDLGGSQVYVSCVSV